MYVSLSAYFSPLNLDPSRRLHSYTNVCSAELVFFIYLYTVYIYISLSLSLSLSCSAAGLKLFFSVQILDVGVSVRRPTNQSIRFYAWEFVGNFSAFGRGVGTGSKTGRWPGGGGGSKSGRNREKTGRKRVEKRVGKRFGPILDPFLTHFWPFLPRIWASGQTCF